MKQIKNMQAIQKMAYQLSKTDFIKYLQCPQEFWLKHHKPELFEKPSLMLDHLFRQGNEVQKLARQLKRFQTSENILVDAELTFQTAEFKARVDIVVTHADTAIIDIYEIKSSSSVKPEHIDDVAFQKMVAEKSGASVGRCYVITINNDYVGNGEVDAEQLFTISDENDITEKVAAVMESTERSAKDAVSYLQSEIEPSLVEYAKSKHERKHEFECVMVRNFFPELPAYTVFHVPRIHKPKLIALLEMGIINLNDIPDTFELSEKQREYLAAAKSTELDIKREEIKERVDTWEYPLHFLDYETFQYAIPQFDGVKPFQQMCFQYSLHTIDAPGAEPRHSKFLAKDGEQNPPLKLAEHMRKAMQSGIGNVFVWYEPFEKGRNSEMAEMFPEHADFFNEVNAKTVDLMKIFSERLYIDPKFKGSSSIKKVLPVLCPDFAKYSDLGISEGLTASISWYRAAKWDTLSEDERTHIFADLEKYCALDTLAMVEIYRVLAALS